MSCRRLPFRSSSVQPSILVTAAFMYVSPALLVGCDQALSHLVQGDRTELVRLAPLGDIDDDDADADDLGPQVDRVVARQPMPLSPGAPANLPVTSILRTASSLSKTWR